MKAKASPSQLKREARTHITARGFIYRDHYAHAEWPRILGELVKELDLVFVNVTSPAFMKRPAETPA